MPSRPLLRPPQLVVSWDQALESGMAKAPAFQFYASDFMVGTMDMTAEETGGYIRLLCYQWDKGSIPNDHSRLLTLTGCTSNALASILVKFKIGSDGLLRNVRLEEVRVKQNEFSKSRADNANKRWSKEADASASKVHQSSICINDALLLQSSSSTPSSISTTTSSPKKDVGPVSAEKLITQAKESPAYKGLDVEREWFKMVSWCNQNKKHPTARRYTNWLNRADIPVFGLNGTNKANTKADHAKGF